MWRFPKMSDELSTPLRVLMVCARYLPDMGGIEMHVYEVARRLACMGNFQVTVLATDRTRTRPQEEVVNGVTILRVPAWPSERDYYIAPAIFNVVAGRGEWDLVHCQGIHTPVPLLAMLAARRAKVPYVVTFHTGGHSLRHRNALRTLQWRLAGPLLRRAGALIAVSRFEADVLSASAGLGDKRVTLIRNGGTLPEPPPGVAMRPGRIVSPGRLERYKGHHRVIEALPHVIEKVPDAHLVVLGQGSYESELRRLADQLGIADRVTIKHVPPGDRASMATALAEANVIAAMSDYEAHPVAVMESLSVGRPVVGYSCAGIGELVEEGWVHGVQPGAKPTEVADHLLKVMSAPAQKIELELPTWDTTANELAKCYLAVSNKGHAGSLGNRIQHNEVQR